MNSTSGKIQKMVGFGYYDYKISENLQTILDSFKQRLEEKGTTMRSNRKSPSIRPLDPKT